MIERVRGARARDEDGSPEPRLAPPGHFDQAGEIPLATRLSSGVDGARLVRGPEALAATPSAGVLSILSDAIRDTAGTYLVTGATVGAGAHLRFTVTFAAGTTASAASTLLFSNGAVAYLATGAGATVGTYILEVTADTAATSALTVAGID